jgi:hypothetical protein
MNLSSILKPTAQNREKTPAPHKAAMKYVLLIFPTVNDNILGSFMQRKVELKLFKLYKQFYLACDSYIHLHRPQTRLFRQLPGKQCRYLLFLIRINNTEVKNSTKNFICKLYNFLICKHMRTGWACLRTRCLVGCGNHTTIRGFRSGQLDSPFESTIDWNSLRPEVIPNRFCIRNHLTL